MLTSLTNHKLTRGTDRTMSLTHPGSYRVISSFKNQAAALTGSLGCSYIALTGWAVFYLMSCKWCEIMDPGSSTCSGQILSMCSSSVPPPLWPTFFLSPLPCPCLFILIIIFKLIHLREKTGTVLCSCMHIQFHVDYDVLRGYTESCVCSAKYIWFYSILFFGIGFWIKFT